MSINTIIAIVAALIVVLGGAYYAMNGGYSMTGDTINTETVLSGDTSEDESDIAGKMSDGTFTGSFFDLGLRGGNYKCSITSTGTNNDTTGVVYVSGADLRGEFMTMANGSSIESNMLKKGDDIYVWSSAMPQGIMMKATAMTGNGSAATQGAGVNGTQDYSWNCSATGSDSSQFALPRGVEFMDMSTMMQGGSIPGF